MLRLLCSILILSSVVNCVSTINAKNDSWNLNIKDGDGNSDNSFSNANFLAFEEISDDKDTMKSNNTFKSVSDIEKDRLDLLNQFNHILNGTDHLSFSVHNNSSKNEDYTSVGKTKSSLIAEHETKTDESLEHYRSHQNISDNVKNMAPSSYPKNLENLEGSLEHYGSHRNISDNVKNLASSSYPKNLEGYDFNFQHKENYHIDKLNREEASPVGHPNWKDVMNILKLGSASYINFINITNVIHASEISKECKKSLMRYLESLSKWEKWAVMMADASGKIPGGILEGTTLDFGSYEECLKIRSYSHEEVENFRGQYCMVGYQSPLLTNLYKIPQNYTKYTEMYGKPPEWIEDFIKRSGKYLKVITFFLGTCVPSSCTTVDVETIASNIVSPLGLNVSVPSCEIDETKVWTTNGIIALSFFVLLAHLCVLGTIVDVACRYLLEDQQSLKLSCLPLYILRTFSLYLNSEKFFARRKEGSNLPFFHGMRFISFTWVVINHTMGISSMWRVVTYSGFLKLDDEIHGHITVPVIENVGAAVETFFLISGFLLVYTTWKKLEQSGGKLNVFRFMIQKFWRLSPGLGFTIALFLMFHHYGSGPIFKASTRGVFDACYTHWMWNFLYINNWWRDCDMCLPHTWFLSALMQSHLIGVVLLIVAYRYPFASIIIGAGIAVGTSIFLALISLFNDHHMPNVYTLKDLDFRSDLLNLVHFKTYTHINTYLIGMAVGYLFIKYNARKLNNVLKTCGWVLAVLLALYVMEGRYAPTDDRSLVALFHATNRTAWALAIGWVTFMCANGNGGMINRFLSWHGFELLGTLSYSAYLLHVPVLYYRNTSLTERFPYGEVEMVCEVVLVTVISCILAVLSYITVEMPFTAIGGLIFKR